MKLVLFDVDGTLVDSQAIIHASMVDTFETYGYLPPALEDTKSIVGLSLNLAISKLLDREMDTRTAAMTDHYKRVYLELVKQPEYESKLFSGTRAMLDEVARTDDVLIGLATGKSRAGIVRLLDDHELHDHIITSRCADDCPSKPHPAMVLECCAEVGIEPSDTCVIGDTTFDMQMSRSAGATAIGVSWGYHPVEQLEQAGADAIAQDWQDVLGRLI